MKSSPGFSASFATVLVRARPPLPSEAAYGHCARTEGKKVVLTSETEAPDGGKRTKAIECQYDKVLGMQSGQEEVWETVLPMVNKAFDGYNVTLFTYGMTGSGKTYTMLGPTLMDSAFEGVAPPSSSQIGKDQNRGVVVRVMQQIFKQVPQARVSLNYVQVYQERCYDLLQPATKALRVREDSQKKPGQNVNVFLEDLTEVVVANVEECLEYLIFGFANVAFRSTNYNEQSSRAHCILTLTVQQQLGDRVRESKVRLVDLAGNERWVMTGPQISPQHARELATINRSMHILGSCLQILSQPPVYKKGIEVNRHVPYRDSTLTLLLRDSLSGNSFTFMMCTICCSVLYQMQTLSTLRFADRVKRVKMKATICDTLDNKEVQSQIQAEVEYLRAAVSGASTARGDVQELKQRVSQLQKACLGLEGENRQLREQIAELEKQPLQKATVKAATRRVRRVNSEPSLPTPDPWFEENDLQTACYRSHDDMGSRMAGRCPKGHRLQSLGSISHPQPAAANAAYFEWHCDRPGCRGSSKLLDLGRFHCSLCQHDLCQFCYDQLVGKSYSRTDVHAHLARRGVHPKPAAVPPKAPEPRADTWDKRTPMNPRQVPKITPRETPREHEVEEKEKPLKTRRAPAPSAPSAPNDPSPPSVPSRTPRRLEADPITAPEKPPYILRLEESAKAFARVNGGKRPNRKAHGPNGPNGATSARGQRPQGGVQSGASIGSASTASTTPESVRKRLLAGSEAAHSNGQGGSVEKSLPPVHSRHPGAAREGDSRRPDRRKDAEVWRHPDIPLRDAIFLPALDEDNWQAPRQSPRKPSAHGSPQLWGRGRSQPPKVAIQPQRDEPSPGQDGSNRSAPPPSRAAPGAPNKLLRPPPVLAPGGLGAADAVDMRTILGELDAKHAESNVQDDATWQASTWPRQSTKPLE